MTRCLLKWKKLSDNLWGEAVVTAAYLLNRCPTKALMNTTPEEAWTGVKPSVKHLRIFGSVFHKHIPDEKRRKLEDKSESLILVGYHNTGAYRMYNPKKNEIVISRDVLVDESATYDWPSAESEPSKVISSWLEMRRPEDDEQMTKNEEINTRRSQRTQVSFNKTCRS